MMMPPPIPSSPERNPVVAPSATIRRSRLTSHHFDRGRALDDLCDTGRYGNTCLVESADEVLRLVSGDREEEPAAISKRCPAMPNPVMSVQA